jgi:hypothetical protein
VAVNEGIQHIQSWSGGKDSTASIVLEHERRDELGIPPSKIVMAELMFDIERGISAEYPDHTEWVREYAKPLLESWGHEVEIVQSKRDYVGIFRRVIERVTVPENEWRIGKKAGFVGGSFCSVKSRMKVPLLDRIARECWKTPQILGICADEPERMGTIDGVQKRSLLAEYGIREAETYAMLAPYGLTSPYYKRKTRGGCWFCPNQPIRDFAWLKREHPELWEELEALARVPNKVSECFKYNMTFWDVAAAVEHYLAMPEQLTLF